VDLSSFAEPLITREEIARRTRELGREITSHYASAGAAGISLVTILKGSFIFLADLVRCIDLPFTVDFMAISSYSRERGSSGTVRLTRDLSLSIQGRDVLMVEDVIDTGLTLGYILRVLREREPRSLEVCTLLDKGRNRIADLEVRFRGFAVDERFVIGYGLDRDELYRNLPDIYRLKEGPPERPFGAS
jgi:hypoxanthine phosphoribosyltransferase